MWTCVVCVSMNDLGKVRSCRSFEELPNQAVLYWGDLLPPQTLLGWPAQAERPCHLEKQNYLRLGSWPQHHPVWFQRQTRTLQPLGTETCDHICRPTDTKNPDIPPADFNESQSPSLSPQARCSTIGPTRPTPHTGPQCDYRNLSLGAYRHWEFVP